MYTKQSKEFRPQIIIIIIITTTNEKELLAIVLLNAGSYVHDVSSGSIIMSMAVDDVNLHRMRRQTQLKKHFNFISLITTIKITL